MDTKSQDGNEEYVFGQWKKGNPCYKVEKNLAELCWYFSDFLEVDLESDEAEYLTEKIAKQSVKEVAWFLPLLWENAR